MAIWRKHEKEIKLQLVKLIRFDSLFKYFLKLSFWLQSCVVVTKLTWTRRQAWNMVLPKEFRFQLPWTLNLWGTVLSLLSTPHKFHVNLSRSCFLRKKGCKTFSLYKRNGLEYPEGKKICWHYGSFILECLLFLRHSYFKDHLLLSSIMKTCIIITNNKHYEAGLYIRCTYLISIQSPEKEMHLWNILK